MHPNIIWNKLKSYRNGSHTRNTRRISGKVEQQRLWKSTQTDLLCSVCAVLCWGSLRSMTTKEMSPSLTAAHSTCAHNAVSVHFFPLLTRLYVLHVSPSKGFDTFLNGRNLQRGSLSGCSALTRWLTVKMNVWAAWRTFTSGCGCSLEGGGEGLWLHVM